MKPRPLLLLLVLAACTGPRTAPQADPPLPEENTAASGGIITEYYENGNVREKYTRIDGKLQGQYLRYHPNGDLDLSLFYKDNKPDGLYTWYYDSGNRVRSTQVFTDGERNSPLTVYYRDGMIKHIFGYSHDKMAGDIVSYYPNGQKQEEMHLGRPDTQDPALNGLVRFYYENGQISESFSYVNLKLEGPYRAYFPDGRVRREGQFSQGRRTGRWSTYEKDGTVSVYDYH